MSNYPKLKTNLKLAIQRLKLLEKKKTELSLKSRKEIADYLAINKADRARIRVEHIIREDNYVEAMEMLEMFCDLLIGRFGLIEKMKELDPGLDESIATIIWASPRVSNDILEFRIIAEILSHKYGKKYAEACKADAINNVNEKVKKRLGLEAPPKLLVEQYLIEIAKNFNVNYVPDNAVMLSSGVMSEELIQLRDQVDDITKRYGSGGGGGGSHAEAPYQPPNTASAYPADTKQIPIGFNDLELLNFEHTNKDGYEAPALPNKQDYGSKDNDDEYTREFHLSPPPSYNARSNEQRADAFSDYKAPLPEDDFLDLPSVPQTNFPALNNQQDQGASIDFDDLQKRFQNLKNK